MQLYPRYAIIYDGFFFLGGQLALICVSTGPLTLTKIDFFLSVRSKYWTGPLALTKID